MNVYTVSRYLRGHEPESGPDWTEFALCAEVDNALFFPEKGEPSASAKAVCRGCEVKTECLGFALENMERYGVWGGFSERERRSIAPRHSAGRSLRTSQSPTMPGSTPRRRSPPSLPRRPRPAR